MVDGPFDGEYLTLDADGTEDVILDDPYEGFVRYSPLDVYSYIWFGWIHPEDL